MTMVKRVLLVALCLLPLSGWGAEQTLTTSFTQLLDEVERTLEREGLALEQQARTDRFAIFYLRREGGGGATVSLYTLPQQDTRVTLTVNSDSPTDPMFERNLLRLLTERQTQ